MEPISASIEIVLPTLNFSASGSSRTSLAVLHLLSAARFSRNVAKLEQANAGEPFGPFWEEVLAEATGNVLTTAAGLEAYANELFVDHQLRFPELRVEVMWKLWELYEQKPVLEKFEFALLLKGAEPFNRGSRPYQDVQALIKLRNGLVHFKPEWSDEAEEHARISSALSGRIAASTFFPGELLFPRAWVTHSCTKWAVESAVSFISEFENRAKFEHRLDPFMDRLSSL